MAGFPILERNVRKLMQPSRTSKLFLTAGLLGFSYVCVLAQEASVTPVPPSPKSFSWLGWNIGVTGGPVSTQSVSRFGYPNSNWTNGRYVPPYTDTGFFFPLSLITPNGLLDTQNTSPWPGANSSVRQWKPSAAVGVQVGYVFPLPLNTLAGFEIALYRLRQTSRYGWGDHGQATMHSPDFQTALDYTYSQNLSFKSAVNSLALLRFKLGHATDSFAAFVTGGPALGRVHSRMGADSTHSVAIADPACSMCHTSSVSNWAGRKESWAIGYNVGLSGQAKLAENLFLKVDYSYYALQRLGQYVNGISQVSEFSGADGTPVAGGAAPSIRATQRHTGHMLQIGLGYAFGP